MSRGIFAFCLLGERRIAVMATPELPINLGEFLLYLEQKFRGLVGQDEQSRALADWFKNIQATALKQTESVQCLGMRNALPFDRIYQPTRLIVSAVPEDEQGAETFAWSDKMSRSIVQGRAFDK